MKKTDNLLGYEVVYYDGGDRFILSPGNTSLFPTRRQAERYLKSIKDSRVWKERYASCKLLVEEKYEVVQVEKQSVQEVKQYILEALRSRYGTYAGYDSCGNLELLNEENTDRIVISIKEEVNEEEE